MFSLIGLPNSRLSGLFPDLKSSFFQTTHVFDNLLAGACFCKYVHVSEIFIWALFIFHDLFIEIPDHLLNTVFPHIVVLYV